MRRHSLPGLGGLGRFIPFLLLAISSTSAAALATQLDGVWIGGFLNQEKWVTVSVRLTNQPKGLSGAADVSFADYENERGLALTAVTVEGSTLRFTAPCERGPVVFEGRESDGVISGTYRFGGASGSFGLTRVMSLSSRDRATYFGAYEVEPDYVVSIFDYAGSYPRFIDYRSGQQSTLYPVAKDVFVSGPGQTTAYPHAYTFRFFRDAGGRLNGVSWVETKGEREHIGQRVAFAEVPLTCAHDSVTLGGTLILPRSSGKHPAIVIAPGDFGSSRDQLKGYAFQFVRLGMAALVFDSRGAGGSTGPLASSSFDELAGDVTAWVDLLRKRQDIDPAKVGVFGFSNSAWTVTLAASRSKNVAFLISQSMSALPPWQQERYRAETQVRLAGYPEDVVQKAARLMDRKFEVARTGQGWDSLQLVLDSYAKERWLPYTNPPRNLDRLRLYWERSFSYDPAPALDRVTCPTLFIFGGVDSNVPVDATVPIIRRATKTSGNKDFEIKIFDKGRHDLIEGKDGGPVEFPLMWRFAPGYWTAMSDWVAKRFLPPPSRG
jgi:pimeloyl-ACP methyl ester carboxylesterase